MRLVSVSDAMAAERRFVDGVGVDGCSVCEAVEVFCRSFGAYAGQFEGEFRVACFGV